MNKMTLNQWVKFQRAMVNSKATGRKVSRYLCANINVIQMQVDLLESKLRVEFGVENYEKAQNIANIIGQNVDANGHISKETVEKIKEKLPEDFEVYEKYNEAIQNLYNTLVHINILPIKEKWLSKEITTTDRYPIESLIKIRKSILPWM